MEPEPIDGGVLIENSPNSEWLDIQKLQGMFGFYNSEQYKKLEKSHERYKRTSVSIDDEYALFFDYIVENKLKHTYWLL